MSQRFVTFADPEIHILKLAMIALWAMNSQSHGSLFATDEQVETHRQLRAEIKAESELRTHDASQLAKGRLTR
jgi:hypothetical protein